MTGILEHIGEFSKYLILDRIFWWGMSMPPLFLLSIFNADLWGFFRHCVLSGHGDGRGFGTTGKLSLYCRNVLDCGRILCGFGRFFPELMDCLAGAGPHRLILACRMSLLDGLAPVGCPKAPMPAYGPGTRAAVRGWPAQSAA